MKACEPRADEWLEPFDGNGVHFTVKQDYDNAIVQMLLCIEHHHDAAGFWAMYAVDRARALGLYPYQAQIESEQP